MSREFRIMRSVRRSAQGLALILFVAGALLAGRTGLYVADSYSEQNSSQEHVFAYSEWDQKRFPDYWRLRGKSYLPDIAPQGSVIYKPLDILGRQTGCYATVTSELMKTSSERERASMSHLKPHGWEYNRDVVIENPGASAYRGRFYNRSHLIAKSLGGEERIENIVTGTRTQNVGAAKTHQGGMAYPETLAREYLKSHPEGIVYYSATPVYDGQELVCRSVLVSIRTDDGSIDKEVEVYNAAYGFSIDYATGDFHESV